MAWICARTNFSNAIKRSMKVMVHFRTARMMADKITLTDSRATDNFIDPEFVKKLGVTTLLLEKPRKVWNIDGTTNMAGVIKEYTDLEVRTGKETKIMRFLITGLGNEHLVLGYPWHVAFEPKFRWGQGTIEDWHLPVVVRSLDWRDL